MKRINATFSGKPLDFVTAEITIDKLNRGDYEIQKKAGTDWDNIYPDLVFVGNILYGEDITNRLKTKFPNDEYRVHAKR